MHVVVVVVVVVHREHLTTAGNVMPSVPFVIWAIGRVEAEIARRRPFSTPRHGLTADTINIKLTTCYAHARTAHRQ